MTQRTRRRDGPIDSKRVREIERKEYKAARKRKKEEGSRGDGREKVGGGAVPEGRRTFYMNLLVKPLTVPGPLPFFSLSLGYCLGSTSSTGEGGREGGVGVGARPNPFPPIAFPPQDV